MSRHPFPQQERARSKTEDSSRSVTLWRIGIRNVTACHDVFPKCALKHTSGQYAGRITDQIRPQKTESQHQTSRRCPAYAVDPLCVIQLAAFDHYRNDQCSKGNPSRRRTGGKESAAKENHQRPQGVSGIGGHKSRQDIRITSRPQSGSDDNGNQTDVATSTSA